MTTTPITNDSPLKGAALLEQFKILASKGLTHSDIAIECGYYTVLAEGPRAGHVRAQSSALNRALLIAQGLVPEVEVARPAQRNTSSKDRVMVGKSGRATITAAALAKIGAQIGDVFSVVATEEGDGLVMRLRSRAETTPAPATTPAAAPALPTLVAA